MRKSAPNIIMKRTTPNKPEIAEKLLSRPHLAIRELNNRSFYHFLEFMWPAVSNEKLQPNWHLPYICQQLQNLAEAVNTERTRQGGKQKIADLIINVPPGSTKTTMVSVLFPAWCWSRWHWMEFIGLSYSNILSLEAAESHRNLIQSERFQVIYPDLRIKRDKNQKSNFQIQKVLKKNPSTRDRMSSGGSRYSTSVGGTLTGFHSHITVVDDPINPEQAVSPVQLDTANRWLDTTLPTRKVHKACSPVIYVMQRLHEDDPTGHKLAKKNNDSSLISLPGEIQNYEEEVSPGYLKEKYTSDGLLDPERMSWGILDGLKDDLGQYGYAGQIGQSPSPPSGGMFEVDKFQLVDRRPEQPKIESIVRYWDKAGTEVTGRSKNKGPAWTVGVKMAKLTNGNFIILNVVRGRWGSGDREKKIKQTAIADGHSVSIGIEQEPGSGGKESAEGTIKNLAGFTVKANSPTGDKVYRADPYSVQVNHGNVHILQASWEDTFVDEHRFFPNSTFKDQVDAAAGAFAFLSSRKKARVMS
jgi:predicted phage terminase large subunit-like protein